ncbi:MAG TPA: DUF4136 domain-containing protein, partial [Cyclobacteriaceae bacterium]|nr:DUF4136 domain-containing protein [Cyclobacteriaceae bacterium]
MKTCPKPWKQSGVIIALCCIVFTSCSTRVVTKTDADRSVDLRQFRTYDWLKYWGTGAGKTPVFIDSLNDATVRDAVDKQMKEAGYVLFRAQPE